MLIEKLIDMSGLPQSGGKRCFNTVVEVANDIDALDSRLVDNAQVLVTCQVVVNFYQVITPLDLTPNFSAGPSFSIGDVGYGVLQRCINVDLNRVGHE
jgi:hypothetical protein